MLYAEELVKNHFLIQKVCSLNMEGKGGENKIVTCILSTQQDGKVQKPAQSGSLVSRMLDRAAVQALTELRDTCKD